MKIPPIWTAAPLGAAVLFPLAASAELFQGPFGPGGTWNVYETVTTATTFKDALEAATASKFDPVTGTVDPGGSVAGNLVSILSQGENDMIAKNLLPTANVWVGLSDRVGVAPGATESQVFGSPGNRTNGWAWTTGEAFSFNAWGGGEPNDAGGEDAAHIRNDGLWNDNTSGYGLNEPVADEHSTAEGAATAFRVVEYRTESATPIAGIKMGSALPAPGTLNAPAGGFGTWGVREVTGLTLAGNVRDSVDLIQSGAGTAHLAQLPKLDVTDPDTNAAGGPFLGGTPIPFLSDTPAVDDNNILTAARGTVQVTEAGTYTIQVRSDDGFALRVVGQQFDSVNGAGYIDPVDPSTIAFHTGTGDANTRGIITLAAGTYDVEFIAWEGGGGAYYEVSSTKGAITDTSGTPAQWLALGDGSTQDAIVPTVRLSSPATVTNAAAPAGQQVTTLAGGRDALANATTTYTREVSVVSITDAQMPIEQQAGVIDDYGTSVIGKITVDNGAGASNETLGITFGLRADDGASLRIVGQDFLSINDFDGGATDAVLLEEGGDQTMVADYLTGDTNAWGYIELTEGEYDFIAYQFERAGGSNINIWWALGDHTATGNTGAQGFQLLTTSTPGNVGLGLVPEPGSALLGLSALALLVTRRRRS